MVVEKQASTATGRRVAELMGMGQASRATKVLRKSMGTKHVSTGDVLRTKSIRKVKKEEIPGIGTLKTVKRNTPKEDKSVIRLRSARSKNKPLFIQDKVRGK